LCQQRFDINGRRHRVRLHRCRLDLIYRVDWQDADEATVRDYVAATKPGTSALPRSAQAGS
jgi:hypothetical protein